MNRAERERLQLNLRLDGRQDLLDAMKEAAEESGLSVNAWAIRAFEAALGISPKAASNTLSPVERRLAALEERVASLEANQLGELAA